MFKKIVRYFAIKRLFKYYQTRQRSTKIKTLKNSKSVGILWNPADEGSIETFELLRKALQIKGIKSTGIAYIGSNREMETLATITHSGFLHRQNVRWFGRPQTSDGIEFMQEPFDIMIDLSINKAVALQYILVYSLATFKVGWQGANHNYYDLNIDVSEKPQCKFLMEQIVFYLESINEKS
ncbi:MAG: hypothetical protein GZ094_09855 [Mariniphaga sp.]|nr:hypothetical protein [Mariniphaga sp.]